MDQAIDALPNLKSKRKRTLQDLQKKSEYLEDISTITYEYIHSKLKTHLFHSYIKNKLEFATVLEYINKPSDGKMYVMRFGSNYIVKIGSEVNTYKNIDFFKTLILEHVTASMTTRLREMMDNGSIINEADICMYKKILDTYRDIVNTLKSPRNVIYSRFKSTLCQLS